jgi:hypothetical protein
MKLTKEQSLIAGQEQRSRLSFVGNNIKVLNPNDRYPHYYIYSRPGLGKTHTIREALQGSTHKVYHLSAAESMFVFGIHLAVLNYATPKDQTILVVLDDAENLLSTTENINIFKGMLDGADRCYKYSKKMDSTLASLSEQIVTAVQHHTKPNEVGFIVPTNRFSFVFTSNIQLPEYSHLDKIKNPSKVSRVMHLLAIRDRVKNVDFDLSDEEMWGWITDAAHNGACVDYPDHIVQEATDFLWDNWSRLKTKSIRLVQQMCDEYTNDPVSYKTVWNLEYRR